MISELALASGELAELDVLQDWKQLILISKSGHGHSYRGAAEGTRLPLPWTASGRFLLEKYSLGQLQKFIPPEDFTPPSGASVSFESLYEEIKAAGDKGFWIASGLVDPYLTCITAPVRTKEKQCIGVVCLVLPSPTLAVRETECVALTMRAAQKLSDACMLLRNPGF